jgi:predicted transcriptional regulator
VIIEPTRATKRIEYRRDIVEWMNTRRMTRRELAEKMSVTQAAVGAWIKRGKMSARNAYKLDNLDG